MWPPKGGVGPSAVINMAKPLTGKRKLVWQSSVGGGAKVLRQSQQLSEAT